MRRAVTVCAALLFALACGEKEDPVRRSLEEMFTAAEARDAGEFLEHLTSDFTGAEGADRAQAERLLRMYFAAYDRLDVAVSDLEIERSPGAARARFVATLSGTRGKGIPAIEALLPSDSRYRFDLRLVEDGGSWKVAWASWELAGGQ
jgi:hypothetical protein